MIHVVERKSALRYRLASNADREFFFMLRNDPDTLRMGRRVAVTKQEHAAWWRSTTDMRYIWFLSTKHGHTDIGIVRIGMDGCISIVVHPDHRRKGYAKQILSKIRQMRRSKINGLRRLFAEIAPENVASQRAFFHAGWSPVVFETLVSR